MPYAWLPAIGQGICPKRGPVHTAASICARMVGRMPLLLFFWMGLVANLAAQTEIVPIRHLTKADGIPAKIVYDITKDNQGFLWICTDNGVCRFDGKNFYHYTTKDGLCDNEIIVIFADSRGNIWCGGYNGKISVIENGVVNTGYDFIRNWNALSNVRAFVEDDEQNVYIATERYIQVFRVDRDRNVQVFEFAKKINTTTNSCGFAFHDGKLWLFGYKGLYSAFKDGSQFRLRELNSRSDDIYLSKAYRSIWYRVGEYMQNIFGGRMYLGPRNADVQQICQVDERFVVVGFGVDDAILYDLRNAAYRPIRLPAGSWVVDAIRDNRGNIWLSIYKQGILCIGSQTEPDAASVMPHLGKEMVQVFGDGDSLFGINTRGHFFYGKAGNIKMTSASVYVLAPLAYGTFIRSPYGLIFSTLRKTFLFKDEKLRPLTSGSKEAVLYKDSLLFLRHSVGIIIRRLDAQNVGRMEEGTLELVDRLNRPYAICLLGDTLWYADKNGVGFYDIPRQNLHQSLYHIPDNGRVEDMITWGSGRLLLCTSNSGVIVYVPGHFSYPITTDHGLFDDHCLEIDSCTRGWVVRHPLALSLVDVQTRNVVNMTEVAGVSASLVNNVYITDNTAYFSTDSGVVRTGVDLLFREKDENREVVFVRVLDNDRRVPAENVQLAPNDNRLKIDYSLPEYNAPGFVQYNWRINDGAWNKAEATSLEFVNLAPGDYTLQVKAKAPGFGWSRTAVLHIHVNTPFWSTWWFMLLAVLLAVGLVWGYSRRNYRKKLAMEREKASVRYQLMDFEQKALNAMMNPHFIFNAMGSIQHLLTQGDNRQANDYLVKFSRLIRKSLETSQLEFCYLDDEIERLTLYLQLEKMRFGGRMDFGIEMAADVDAEQLKIPTMILQTYVENAIIHGVAAMRHHGRVDIRLRKQDGMLYVSIEDNGPGFDTGDKAKRSVRFGVSATEKRLELLTQLSGRPYSVKVISPVGPQGGTRVELLFSV